jgi:general secretion pathway protein B
MALIALAMAMVVASAGFWWLGHRGTEVALEPEVAEQAPTATPTDAEMRELGAEPNAQEQALAADQSATPAEIEEAAPPQRRRRTVVDRRSPDQQPVTAVSRPAPARPGAVRTPPPVVPDGERERLVTDANEARQIVEARQQNDPTQSADALQGQESASGDRAIAERGQPVTDEAGQPAQWEPERTEFIEVWDLPLAVRRELPDLEVSIHVFSTKPEDRFVLINGERRLEGAALGGGARLLEVAREGAIVEYRDYRFLLRP